MKIKQAQQWSIFDRQMMTRGLQLAKLGEFTARPNPMVGCVLTKDNQVIGEGWHQKAGQPHAEINAIKAATTSVRGATCYVTLEPCAHTGKTGPCADALIQAGVSKVVAAMQDPNPQVSGQGFKRLIDAGIEVEYGLYEAQATELNRGFVSRFNRSRPWLNCKLAMSLDGRTALADGSSKWITGAAARDDVQRLRAKQDGIITGMGTLHSDDPSLTVRAENSAWFAKAKEVGFSQPHRILLDRKAEAKTSAKLFNADAKIYWISDAFEELTVKSNVYCCKTKSSLEQQLAFFAEQGMNTLLLEAGHRLAGQFLNANLIDELIVYVAPKLMGSHGLALFELEIESLQQATQLKLMDVRQLDEDIRLTYQLSS